MKKISGILLLLLIINGCTTLPATVEIDPAETGDVVESFKAMVGAWRQCDCSVDAEADIEFNSFFYHGVVNGYLQAMSPSYLKFVGINPLGQPLVVLLSDGEYFHYLVVPQAKAYQGNVHGRTFTGYAPDGFQPGFVFSWLVGRLAPGVVKILTVSRGRQEQGYWLRLLAGKGSQESLVLFDDQAGVIRRRLIMDKNNEIVMNVLYDAYTSAPCPLPGSITIESPAHNSSMEIKLTGWLDNVALGPEEFSCHLPAGFSRVMVP